MADRLWLSGVPVGDSRGALARGRVHGEAGPPSLELLAAALPSPHSQAPLHGPQGPRCPLGPDPAPPVCSQDTEALPRVPELRCTCLCPQSLSRVPSPSWCPEAGHLGHRSQCHPLWKAPFEATRWPRSRPQLVTSALTETGQSHCCSRLATTSSHAAKPAGRGTGWDSRGQSLHGDGGILSNNSTYLPRGPDREPSEQTWGMLTSRLTSVPRGCGAPEGRRGCGGQRLPLPLKNPHRIPR